MCQAGRSVSVSTTLAVAVNDRVRCEVLDMALGASETEAFRTDFLRSLTRRSLRGVQLAVSDDHKGLQTAVMHILGATSQHCRRHCMRNLRAPAVQQGRRVTTAFAQRDAARAFAQWY